MDPLSILISPSISSLASSTSSSNPQTTIEHVESRSPNVGFSYRMDKISGKMEKVDDETARLSAELYRYGAESNPSAPTTPSMSTYYYPTTPMRRIFAPNGDVTRIFQQFPSVDEGYIKQLMKLYNNRENLVISALLSEGYTRPNFIIDESLFYKMKATFPKVDNEIIRKVLIQKENKEHAAIAALLGMFGLFNTVRYKYSGDYLNAKYVKLKYLMRKYPDIDEQVMFGLLYEHDHNAQKVVDYLKNLGCEQSELKVKISKVSEVSLMKQAYSKLNTPRPKELSYIQREHANFEEQESIKRKIQEKFKDIDSRLITIACEAADFEMDLAICFIETMTLPDDPDYITDTIQQRFFRIEYKNYSRWMQTGFEFQDLFGVPVIESEMENKIENDYFKNDDDDYFLQQLDNILNPKPKIMKNQATWTKEDEELTRRPPEMVCRPKCKALGSSITKEERPVKLKSIEPKTKAFGSRCKANGPAIPEKERIKRMTPIAEKCRPIRSMGRQVVRIKDQIVYNAEDDIIEVDNYIF